MATRPSTLRTNPAASDTTYRRNPRETVADRIKRFERYEVRTEESKDYPLFGRGFLALAAQRYSEDEYVRLVAAALELDGRWGLLAEPSAYPAPKGVLLKALKDRYAAERTKPITVEVRFRDMWEATAYVGEGRYDRTEVGFVVAAPDYPLACPEEYATLRKAHGDAPTYEVVSSRVHPLMQRKGLGVRLYRALGETLGRERGAYLFANACGSRGDTSAEAQRVYRSLSRDFPAEGLVVYFPPTKVNPRRNGRGGYTSAMRTDPELWEEVKAEVTRGSKGGLPGQWSARKAQLAVALYRSRGGDYYGPKSPYNALAKWTREKWRTKSGRPSLETGERYLPSAAIAALTPAEYAATTRAKRAGMKKGQQFVPQPEAVAKKVGRYRRNPRDPQTDTPAFRRWFGDSRVVDVRGGPLVVYHGSSKEDIEEFEVPRNRRRESIFFFSDERTVAQEYGDTVYPVYLRVLNPLVVDARGRDWASIPQSAVKFHGWEEDDVEAAKSIMDDRSDDGSTTSTDVIAHIASLYGFDGAIIRNVVDSASGDRDQPSTVYAVFDATNIKSATRNVGTYDPHSRNIYENPRRNPAQPEAVAKKVRRYRRNSAKVVAYLEMYGDWYSATESQWSALVAAGVSGKGWNLDRLTTRLKRRPSGRVFESLPIVCPLDFYEPEAWEEADAAVRRMQKVLGRRP